MPSRIEGVSPRGRRRRGRRRIAAVALVAGGAVSSVPRR
ncbi:hypothetical protein I546_6937 [Mycobacterium kansasii 732]|nr:hypothetical protein I546_6937 [Mycobacterium kansasii 732]